MKPKSEEFALQPTEASAPAVDQPSSLAILQAAITGGITSDNVAVVKEIIAMRREEMAFQNKQAFNRAFFSLKTEIAGMDFYADKEAKDYDGNVMYRFCSERELSAQLEPVLFKHGFAMMFGQRQENERVVAEVTLIHSEGHEEKREYAVRLGATNKMKDATQADAGSTTSAWRNLVIKLFGIKSRITDKADVRNEGEFIDDAERQYLLERIAETGSKIETYLKLASAENVQSIHKNIYPVLIRALAMKKPAAQ